MTSREYKRDLRWPVGFGLTLIGAGLAFTTRWLNGDTWREFIVVAAYGIGWALTTFAAIYLIGKTFENWEWGREDHDLEKIFKDGLK